MTMTDKPSNLMPTEADLEAANQTNLVTMEDGEGPSMEPQYADVVHDQEEDHVDEPEGNDEEEGDELDNARSIAKNETARLRVWRFVVTDTIIMISVVLILTTYTIQREAEHVNFQEQFIQFAVVLQNHVIKQQHVLRLSLLGLAATISSSAELVNNPWPQFAMPHLETHAQKLHAVAGVQALAMFSKVAKEERQEWVEFSDVTHEDVVLTNSRIAGTQSNVTPVGYHSYITRVDAASGEMVQDWNRDFYYPSLAWSPPPLDFSMVNWNVGSDSGFHETIQALTDLQVHDEVLYTYPQDPDPLFPVPEEPITYAMAPIHLLGRTISVNASKGYENDTVVGIISSTFSWGYMLERALPQDIAIVAVIQSASCGKIFSYLVTGPDVAYLGPQDMHDPGFDQYVLDVDLSTSYYQHPNIAFNTTGHCVFTMQLYPTASLWDSYVSFNPEVYAIVLSLLFFVIVAVYFFYDKLVDSRNEKMITRFASSNAIVASLFPKGIKERLMEDMHQKKNQEQVTGNAFMSTTVNHLKNGISTPLADLFPEVTILFSDLAGFTAWSSGREPTHVFILLETLYSAFDEIAETHRIFKVETVGDCYVAAAGVPNRRRDHALAMVRFARGIHQRMHLLIKSLETALGPEAGALSLRTGIHSGPVTAGILRGKKARFQLFGDTMNTTSRIETTGLPGHIHTSEATAQLLCKAGRSHWVNRREDLVAAKGKGVMQTYWVTLVNSGTDAQSMTSSGSHSAESDGDTALLADLGNYAISPA